MHASRGAGNHVPSDDGLSPHIELVLSISISTRQRRFWALKRPRVMSSLACALLAHILVVRHAAVAGRFIHRKSNIEAGHQCITTIVICTSGSPNGRD
jgi:hypothetical protein